MPKPVTTFTYDMEPFLKSCVDRYVNLAGRDAKPLKHVSIPFHEERIARPVADEKETSTGSNRRKSVDESAVCSEDGQV